MKLKSPMFWVYLVVILYLVSMLVYVSVEFFGGADVNKISAFGSVLGGIGTIFAGLLAIYLFNDWRDEKEYELVKESSLSLLEATLNINSTLENFLAIVFEFLDFSNQNEFDEYCKWCDQFSSDFMQNLIMLKTENNKHHGLVLDFEKDEKLFTLQDLTVIMNIFNKITENVDITIQNNSRNEKLALNPIYLKEYQDMINPKIKYLNKKCNPKKN